MVAAKPYNTLKGERKKVYMFVHIGYLVIWVEPPFWRDTFPLSMLKSREIVLYFKKYWLLFNITAYSLHLAAALPFYLELNFFHYVIFFLNPGVQGPQKSIPSALQLYLLFSRRPYGNRLVCYYLSISSAVQSVFAWRQQWRVMQSLNGIVMVWAGK